MDIPLQARAVSALLLQITDIQNCSNSLCPTYVKGVAGLIGNTPLVKISSLSEVTGCQVMAAAVTAQDAMLLRTIATSLLCCCNHLSVT